MEKKRIIIYGIGKRFSTLFLHDGFMNKVLNNLSYTIVGICDKDYDKAVRINEIAQYRPIVLDDIKKFNSEFILISSSIYFSEIKQNLIEKGVDKKQVISTSDLVIDYLQISDAVEKNGIEIGGPSSIFGPIYDRCLSCDDVNFSSNTVWWMEDDTNNYYFEDKKIGKVYIADATDMSCIENDKYDFLLSSNNLEHIANPIKALKEFVRVVNINGKVIVAVPDKEQTFDHNREYTSFEHMLNDYTNNIEENDLSHLKEIINEHDYSMDPQCGGNDDSCNIRTTFL